MEKDFCNKCGECCRNIVVDFNKKIVYWDGIQPLSDDFATNLIPLSEIKNYTVCTCKFLKNDLCTNMQKPEICTNYPSAPFTQLPENCGYEGKIFIEQERIKQRIRKLKEDILHYSVIIETSDNKFENNQLKKIISSHQKWIDKYRPFGSDDW